MILELLLKLLTRLGAIKWTFGFSEVGVPVIPAAAQWLASVVTTQTGTLTNGSPNITALTTTAGLSVGQSVTISIAGLPQPAYITSIISGTSVGLNQTFAGTTGSATVSFYPYDANQSVWAGAFSGFSGPPQSAIVTDTPDCPFNIPDAQVVPTGTTFVPAPGRGVVTMSTFTTTAGGIQYNINGTWTSVWLGSTAAASSAYTMADGVNVRWNNLGSAAVTFTFYRERSSKSTSI
ncbi:MAG TPA: hypothetical protein VK673_21760 [Chthoniobacterales bacterium]|nr:hypothetical protein [Chthoniobacterales bacterium]